MSFFSAQIMRSFLSVPSMLFFICAKSNRFTTCVNHAIFADLLNTHVIPSIFTKRLVLCVRLGALSLFPQSSTPAFVSLSITNPLLLVPTTLSLVSASSTKHCAKNDIFGIYSKFIIFASYLKDTIFAACIKCTIFIAGDGLT